MQTTSNETTQNRGFFRGDLMVEHEGRKYSVSVRGVPTWEQIEPTAKRMVEEYVERGERFGVTLLE